VDGALRAWSRESGDGWKLSAEARSRTAITKTIVASMNRQGKWASVSDGTENIYLWDTAEGEDMVLLGRHDDRAEHPMQWSPDGSRLVTTLPDARIWNVRGATAPIVLRGHESTVTFAAWSPDGKRIVTSSLDATARVWNADGSGQPVILRGHGDGLSWATFSPDGARIATASWDTTVRVWNADGAGVPFVLGGAPIAVMDVFWSPDGEYIAARTEEKVARIWRGVQPLSGPGDARLWKATSYCIPASIRIDLLHVTEAEARKDQETCERHVERARAAEGGPGAPPRRDTLRP
jgi:WD40 repeat protein